MLVHPFKIFQIQDETNNAYFVIWTTTLDIRQLAVATSRETYCEVKVGGNAYWIAQPRVETFIKECNFSEYSIGRTCAGVDLSGKITRHPFIDRESKVVTAEYVTMDAGTGCVHIAPGHGLDDYLTGLEHGLEIYCPLDDGGKYLDDGQIPPLLVGISVLEKKDGSKANHVVLEILRSGGSLLSQKEHQTNIRIAER